VRPDTYERSGHEVTIPSGEVFLHGDLAIPPAPRGVVVFAHGSGSGRFSPRNRSVAAALREGSLATLLFDLLTPEEEEAEIRTAHLRFDIGFLATRLLAAVDWTASRLPTRDLDLGLFGASTGAAAALVAAAQRPSRVAAIVSRGGRPDLAGPIFARVRCPTLLVVGGEDRAVLRLNQEALAALDVEKDLQVIPGATHLFEEPGTLDQVAGIAREWFVRYLKSRPPRRDAVRRPPSPDARE
jgi:putative phosphoribosyl transferase